MQKDEEIALIHELIDAVDSVGSSIFVLADCIDALRGAIERCSHEGTEYDG